VGVAGSPVIGGRRGAFSTLLRRPGLRASSDGVMATKSERKMLASTCLYSLYAWLFLYLGRKFLDSGSQPSLNGSPRKFAHKFDVGSSLKTYYRKYFYATPKNFGRGKPQISSTYCCTVVQVFSDWSSVGVALRSHPGVRHTVAWDAAGFTDVWRASSLQPWPSAIHLVQGMLCRHLLNAWCTIPPLCRWYSVLWPLPSHRRVHSVYANASVFML